MDFVDNTDGHKEIAALMSHSIRGTAHSLNYSYVKMPHKWSDIRLRSRSIWVSNKGAEDLLCLTVLIEHHGLGLRWTKCDPMRLYVQNMISLPLV